MTLTEHQHPWTYLATNSSFIDLLTSKSLFNFKSTLLILDIISLLTSWLALAFWAAIGVSLYFKYAALHQIILIEIHPMQGWAATTRHGVTRKWSTKGLKSKGNLFRKNLQLVLIGVC